MDRQTLEAFNPSRPCDRPNRTAEHARLRVMDAKSGYLSGPATVEFLTALRAELYAWLDTCESALAIANRLNIRDEESCPDCVAGDGPTGEPCGTCNGSGCV